jgi:hypothetical protein
MAGLAVVAARRSIDALDTLWDAYRAAREAEWKEQETASTRPATNVAETKG